VVQWSDATAPAWSSVLGDAAVPAVHSSEVSPRGDATVPADDDDDDDLTSVGGGGDSVRRTLSPPALRGVDDPRSPRNCAPAGAAALGPPSAFRRPDTSALRPAGPESDPRRNRDPES